MNPLPTSVEIDRFHQVLRCQLGLKLAERYPSELAQLLRRRLEHTGDSLEAYLARLQSPTQGELRLLSRELTVPESFFFRSAPQLRALVEHALPARIQARAAHRALRLLSAGCAGGEEPYSLAILLREHFPQTAGWDVSIRGIDINSAVLEKAARARYNAWSMRGVAEKVQRRWFSLEGRDLVLDGTVCAMVTFEERNLLEDDPALWAPGTFDVIFCRNVLLYLTPDAADTLLAHIAKALVPGGFLFLGHSETPRALPPDLHLCQHEGAFYYQRRLPPSPAPGATS